MESLEVVVNLVANTATQKGLSVKAKADKRQYGKGLKVTDGELKNIKLKLSEFKGNWNYTISP